MLRCKTVYRLILFRQMLCWVNGVRLANNDPYVPSWYLKDTGVSQWKQHVDWVWWWWWWRCELRWRSELCMCA